MAPATWRSYQRGREGTRCVLLLLPGEGVSNRFRDVGGKTAQVVFVGVAVLAVMEGFFG
jgi:hypothetical protein